MPEPTGIEDVIEASSVTDATDARVDFDARFELARGRLLKITASLVGPDDAEDVVQDTYLLGRRRFDQLRDPSAFEPWLTRIAGRGSFATWDRQYAVFVSSGDADETVSVQFIAHGRNAESVSFVPNDLHPEICSVPDDAP